MIQKTVILFADIVGSTKLYERLGDETAYECVSQSLALVQESVERFDGQVLEVIGDEIMASFPNVLSAINASCDINETFRLPLPSGHAIAIRIGFHSGDVGFENGQPYGDTVNVAARMASLAEARQIVFTSSSLDVNTDLHGITIRSFKRAVIKGKTDPVRTSEVVWDNEDATSVFSAFHLEDTAAVKISLILCYGDEEIVIPSEQGSYTLGRSQESNLSVQALMASRNHLKLDYRWGAVILTDTSTNGTYIAREGKEEHVHRREYRLDGQGVITLGSPGADGVDHAIGFRVEQLGQH